MSEPDVEALVETALERIRRDRQIRRRLPGGGLFFMDGRMPFLFVHRGGEERELDPVSSVAQSQRSFLIQPGSAVGGGLVPALVHRLATAVAGELGAFVVVEIWEERDTAGSDGNSDPEPPAASVLYPRGAGAAARCLVSALRDTRVARPGRLDETDALQVRPVRSDHPGPPGVPPLTDAPDGARVAVVGVRIAPFYRHGGTGRVLPGRLRVARRALADALRRGMFEYARRHTTVQVGHARAFGRRRLDRRAYLVDRRLREVAGRFDLLLEITPTNADEAWCAFRDAAFETEPRLRYRPLSIDPEALKRHLFSVPIEEVEDPLTADLFREKQEELDLRITLLANRGTKAFLPLSMALFGTPSGALVELAHAVLERTGPGRDPVPAAKDVGVARFRERVEEEVRRYARQDRRFACPVEVRNDVISGLMVTDGRLLINEGLRLSAVRAEALLHHEVGTHVVTHFNGSRQELSLLADGLANYGTLQEGLAVIAEYLAGGLTPSRMQTLAARVIAVHRLVEGEGLRGIHRALTQLDVSPRKAFFVAVRAVRSGGCTKDLQYLDGLVRILSYLDKDGPLSPLFVGKVGLGHLDAVHELMLRGVIRRPAVTPHYALDEGAARRLEECRGRTVLDLVDEITREGAAA